MSKRDGIENSTRTRTEAREILENARRNRLDRAAPIARTLADRWARLRAAEDQLAQLGFGGVKPRRRG